VLEQSVPSERTDDTRRRCAAPDAAPDPDGLALLAELDGLALVAAPPAPVVVALLPVVVEDVPDVSAIAVISTRLPTYFERSSLFPSSAYVVPAPADAEPDVPTLLVAEPLGLALVDAEAPGARIALVSMNCSPPVEREADAELLALLDALLWRQPTIVTEPRSLEGVCRAPD